VIARLRAADWIALAGGAALFISLFLPWYGIEVVLAGGPPQRLDASAWEAFGVLDVVLLLLALVPAGLVYLQATDDSPTLPSTFSMLATLAGMLAVLLIAYRLLNQPGPNDLVGVRWGAWIGLLAALTQAVGSWRSMRDEAMPGVPMPSIEHRPAPAP
jgi:hypothetical protein